MKLTEIKETCLYVKDLDATKEFYTGKLGLECFDSKPDIYAFFRVGSDVLLCFNPEASKVQTTLPPHYGSGHLHFAFECESDEYDKWKEHLTALNIPILQELTWPSGSRSFYFLDPDEHVVEIEQPGLWTSPLNITMSETWPPELDALVAAPRHHKLLFENDAVRVLDTLIPPGETTAVHTHCWPASHYVISSSDFIRYDADGNVILDSRNLSSALIPSTALWSEPLSPHSLSNIGNNPLHIISVEIKG